MISSSRPKQASKKIYPSRKGKLSEEADDGFFEQDCLFIIREKIPCSNIL
jgi:hypothetical protein